MKAWPARAELQQVSVAQGVIGVGMLVAAVVSGGAGAWIALTAATTAVLMPLSVYWTWRRLAKALPAPEGLVAETRRAVLLRIVSLAVLSDLFGVAIGIVVSSVFFGAFGVLAVSAAIKQQLEARAVARWELGHGGRLLRWGNAFVVV